MADVPVFEISLDYLFNVWQPKSLQYHYDLASELSELRRRGILIIGSGNIVHNLSLIDWNIDAQAYPWAVAFDEKVKENILTGNHLDLIRYQNIGHSSVLSVPTPDHYLPMIYVLSLQEENEPVNFTYEGFQHGSVSMRCFQIG
jgi:4,5-DOPA dioxygenase extradiol